MNDEEILLVSLLLDQVEDPSDISSAFSNGLTLHSRRFRQGKIRRGALLPPHRAPFMHLFNSKQDDALVTVCGFDHRAFECLHSRFKVLFDKYSPYQDGGQ
jgi:hypothetical protein